MATLILLILAAYFFCSIPTAYLLTKLLKGIDLRTYGSGSVTGSNAGQALGKWAVVAVGILDILKGAGPVWAAQYLDESRSVQMLAGIAGVAGHNWSAYLGFQGGRGMAVVIGVMLAIAQLELLLFIIIAIFGIAFIGNIPVVMGFSMALSPMWAYLFDEEAPVIWGLCAIIALIIAKRLTGNWTPLPRAGGGKVLLNRFLYDRDTKERQAWVTRRAVDNRAATQETK